jgi:hypothetical protein
MAITIVNVSLGIPVSNRNPEVACGHMQLSQIAAQEILK